jgi:hypothetical protein
MSLLSDVGGAPPAFFTKKKARAPPVSQLIVAPIPASVGTNVSILSLPPRKIRVRIINTTFQTAHATTAAQKLIESTCAVRLVDGVAKSAAVIMVSGAEYYFTKASMVAWRLSA